MFINPALCHCMSLYYILTGFNAYWNLEIRYILLCNLIKTLFVDVRILQSTLIL